MKHFPDWVKERENLKIEMEIISRVITQALKEGRTISVCDGEEWPVKKSRDRAAIERECFATDYTLFRIRDASGENIGFVDFIHGNAGHVISDCTDNETIDAILAPAIAYSESQGW